MVSFIKNKEWRLTDNVQGNYMIPIKIQKHIKINDIYVQFQMNQW